MTQKTSSAGSSRQFPICCILSLNLRAPSGNWEMFRKRRHRAPTRQHGRAGPAAGHEVLAEQPLRERSQPGLRGPAVGSEARRPRTRVPGSTGRRRGCHGRSAEPGGTPGELQPPPQPGPGRATPPDRLATLARQPL